MQQNRLSRPCQRPCQQPCQRPSLRNCLNSLPHCAQALALRPSHPGSYGRAWLESELQRPGSSPTWHTCIELKGASSCSTLKGARRASSPDHVAPHRLRWSGGQATLSQKWSHLTPVAIFPKHSFAAFVLPWGVLDSFSMPSETRWAATAKPHTDSRTSWEAQIVGGPETSSPHSEPCCLGTPASSWGCTLPLRTLAAVVGPHFISSLLLVAMGPWPTVAQFRTGLPNSEQISKFPHDPRDS